MQSPDLVRSYIQTIASISRSVGHRLGPELKRLVPLCLNHCEKAKSDGDIELIENTLQATGPCRRLTLSAPAMLGSCLPERCSARA